MTSVPPRIVVLGSINMDLVVRCEHLPSRGETIIAQSSAEVPGGKGANQAVAAARAGGDVAMIGRVGDDAFADRLIENLLQERVSIGSIRRSQSSLSGIAVVAVEESGENAIMVISGANGLLTVDDVNQAADLIRSADALLVQLEISLETVAAAIEIAKEANVSVILDPAPMPRSFGDTLLHVDVVCPNQSEASTIVGEKIDTIDDAREAVVRLCQLGASNAIITLAGNGAVVGDGKSADWIPPFVVTAVDTTAAGDAFAGALAVRMAEGHPLVEAAKFACAAGALAATRHGAQPGMPTRSEIERLLGGS